eukprot:5582223-Pyramimonas_sp.AAC.1
MVGSIPEHAAGGVAFILPCMTQQAFDDGVAQGRFRHTALVPGRARRLALKAEGVHPTAAETTQGEHSQSML